MAESCYARKVSSDFEMPYESSPFFLECLGLVPRAYPQKYLLLQCLTGLLGLARALYQPFRPEHPEQSSQVLISKPLIMMLTFEARTSQCCIMI